MRWFIVFLIVANVILFFWVKQQSQPVPGTSALPPPDIGRLRLLSESEEGGEEVLAYEDDEASSTIDPAARELPPVEPASSTTEPAEVAVGLDEAPPARPAPEIELADADPVIASVSPGPEGVPVDGPPTGPDVVPAVDEPEAEKAVPAPEGGQPETERQAPDQAAQMVSALTTAGTTEAEARTLESADDLAEPILPPVVQATATADTAAVAEEEADDQAQIEAEPGTDASPAEGGAAAEPAAVEIVAVEQEQSVTEESVAEEVMPAPLCARIGPFEPEDADRLVERLPQRLELVSDDSEEYASVDRYYVLIPALPSRSAGRRKLEELADAGFTDTWLFPSGEYRNAISMGYFSRESRAQAHAANIAKKGFEAEVREKTTLRQRRWLVLKSGDGEGPGSRLTLPKGAGVESLPCP